MARENARWGYLRIKGELLKLGIRISGTTIANVLRRGGLRPAPRRIGPTWSQFLRAQAFAILPAGGSPGTVALAEARAHAIAREQHPGTRRPAATIAQPERRRARASLATTLGRIARSAAGCGR